MMNKSHDYEGFVDLHNHHDDSPQTTTSLNVPLAKAYAPGQVRVRTTPDGRHWETVWALSHGDRWCGGLYY